jgi:trigger factor
MSVTIENGSGKLDRKLKVVYKQADCKAAYDQKLVELSKTVKLPGFQPGKVPVKAVRRQFGTGVLHEVLEKQIPEMISKKFEAEKIRPAYIPQIDLAAMSKEHDMDEDVVVELEFEVFPEVKLVDLKGESLKKPVVKIGEADMKETLERMQQMHTQYKEVERVAKKKDKLMIDFDGVVDGKAFEGGSGKDMAVIIGDKGFIAGFEEGLVGLKKADKKDLNLTFPKDYGSKDLAGKPVVFKVVVKAVQEPDTPKLDDEFAKKFDIKDLAKLKEEVTQNLEQQAKNKLSELKKTRVGDLLVKKIPLEVPKYLVEQEVKHMKESMFAQFNLPKEQKDQLVDSQETTKEMTAEATKRVQLGLIFNTMVQEYKIQPKEADIEKAVTEMAQMYENPAQARMQLMKDQNTLSHIYQMVVENDLVERVYKDVKSEDEAVEFKKLLAGK